MKVNQWLKRAGAALLSLALLTTLLVNGIVPTAAVGVSTMTFSQNTVEAGSTTDLTITFGGLDANTTYTVRRKNPAELVGSTYANAYDGSWSVTSDASGNGSVLIASVGNLAAGVYTFTLFYNTGTGWDTVGWGTDFVYSKDITVYAAGQAPNPQLTANTQTGTPGTTFTFTLTDIPSSAEFGVLEDDGNGNPVKATLVSGSYATVGVGSTTKTVTISTAGNYVAAVWTEGWNFFLTLPITVASPTTTTVPKSKPAAPAAPVPTIRLATSLKVLTVAGYEYKLNDGAWQASPTFSGLTPNTTYKVYQRVAETATTAASDSSPAVEMTTRLRGPAAPAAPVATIRMATSLKVLTVAGYQYKLDDGEWQNSAKFTGLKPGTTYRVYQRIAMTDTHNPSDASEPLYITTRQRGPAAPAAPVATIRLATSLKVATLAGYQYKLDDGEWQNSPTFKNLKPGTTYKVYQRIAQTETHNPSDASPALVITTRLRGPAAPAKPVATIRTAYSIKVETKAGYEYRINDGEWQNNPRFNDLQPNTTYKIYQRIAMTDTHNPSDSSPAVWVTTLDGPARPTTTTTAPTTVPTTTTTTTVPTTTTTTTVTTTTTTKPALSTPPNGNYNVAWQAHPGSAFLNMSSQFDAQADAMLNTINSRTDSYSSTYKIARGGTIPSSISAGSTLLLERGGVYRIPNGVTLNSNVTIAAYGTGARPCVYGSARNYYGVTWSSQGGNIWKLNTTFSSNVGVVVVNHGDLYGQWVETKAELDKAMEFWCDYNNGNALYLYSTIDPNTFKSVEIGVKQNLFSGSGLSNVTFENITFKYTGAHAIGTSNMTNLTVRGCEFGFIGGSVLNYDGLNSSAGVTRYGNAVEIMGNSTTVTVDSCWFYQIYDSATTCQGNSGTSKRFTLKNSLCEYVGMGSYEYWGVTHENTTIEGNIMRWAGYGHGGAKGNNGSLRAHIQSNAKTGGSGGVLMTNFIIRNNIFDQSAYQLLNVCFSDNSTVTVDGNTYVQKNNRRYPLGYFGPTTTQMLFDANVATTIKETLGDNNATVYYV